MHEKAPRRRRSLSKGLNMILNGSSLSFGGTCKPYNPCISKSYKSASPCIRHPPSKVVVSCARRSSASHGYPMSCSKGFSFLDVSSASSPLLGGEYGGLSHAIRRSPRQRRLSLVPRASKDSPFNFKFPPMTKKPMWLWRTIACLPYLMPLHETWMYAETAYFVHPFLEDFEFLTMPFLKSLGRLPRWFLIAYFFFAYLGIVRRKEWPHFLRFHVVTGMLLEISLQVVGTVSRWMPIGLYWGKIGQHFWTFFAFAFMFTVLDCIKYALLGMYADVPFVSDAAYIQIPYD